MQHLQHRDVPLGHRHGFVNWIFETEDQLNELNSVTLNDLHKVAYVEERDQYFSVSVVDVGTGTITWKAWQNTASSTADLFISWNNGVATINAGGAPIQIPVVSSAWYGFMSPAQAVKLANIQANATANFSNEALLNRENHTGQQPSSTIADFTTAVNSLVAVALLAGFSIRVPAYAYAELPDPTGQNTDTSIVVHDGPDGYKPYWSDGTNWVDAMGTPLPPYVPPEPPEDP